MSIYLKKSSDTLVVVLHEIYGINKNIEEKCNELHQKGFDVVCPDMLGTGTFYSYENEEEAYSNFVHLIGFDRALVKVQLLLESIHSSYKHVIVTGYSVGATLAWLCSNTEYCDGVVCYYGSRIRDYTDIIAKCPVQLYFAEKEKSLDVNSLVERLKEKENIEFIGTYPSEHGFADRYSRHYDEESSLLTSLQLAKFIEKIRTK